MNNKQVLLTKTPRPIYVNWSALTLTTDKGKENYPTPQHLKTRIIELRKQLKKGE